MKTVLIVEDSDHKRDRVLAFIGDNFPDLEVDEVYSFTGAGRAIGEKKYDLLIMDMSLPTYDRSAQDSGGSFRTLGGREIARKIIRRKLSSKIIFITQYDSFSDDVSSFTLKGLDQILRQDCGENYAGFIFFDGSKSSWKEQLERIILSL